MPSSSSSWPAADCAGLSTGPTGCGNATAADGPAAPAAERISKDGKATGLRSSLQGEDLEDLVEIDGQEG